MSLKEFLAEERERVKKRATLTVVSANIGRWLGGLSSIPNEAVEAGRAVLLRAQQDGLIRDFRVYPFGQDLFLQLNTLGQGLHHPKVHKLAYEAAVASLSKAAEKKWYRPIEGQDFFRLAARERIVALRLRPVELPFTERGAEPIVIAKLMNGAAGAFNRMLFNLFFHPDKGSHQRLDGTGDMIRAMILTSSVPLILYGGVIAMVRERSRMEQPRHI